MTHDKRFFTDTADANIALPLTPAEWQALPPHMRVAQRLAEVLLLLDTIREEIYTEEGCSMLWMEDTLEQVSTEADWVLFRLSV